MVKSSQHFIPGIDSIIMLKIALILCLATLTQGAWVLDWSDDFNGDEGWAPDGSKWNYDIGGGGWGNEELEYYTSSPNNVVLDGAGHLVITARTDDAWQYQCWYGTCSYTSARLLTSGKFQQTYGRFEASIKIPWGQGTWPAFWMLGSDINSNPWPNCGEIDIVEVKGSDPSTIMGTIHGPGYSGAQGPTQSYHNPSGTWYSEDYHLFAVEWSPDAITWFVDNTAYSTKTPNDIYGNTWVFNHDFFILLDFAVGGIFDGNPGPDTPFPQSMAIDYVRVYKQG